MVHGSNGAGDGASFATPPAPGDGIFGMPHAPGEPPPLDTRSPMLPMPAEHRTAAPGPPPETVQYEGGGIFAASTPGPADQELSETERDPLRAQGSDFNPEVALPAPMHAGAAPMPPAVMQLPAPMMQSVPMAAPMMPDVGAPPVHGGVLGQAESSRGTLGFTVIAVTATGLS